MDAERIAAIRARLDGLSGPLWMGSEVLSSDLSILLALPTDLADVLAEVERLRCLLAASLLGDLSRADRKTLVAHYAT